MPSAPELVQAFQAAVELYRDWPEGGNEPYLKLEGRYVTISRVCHLVWMHRDPMPAELIVWFEAYKEPEVSLPDFQRDGSYAVGASYLAKLIEHRRKAWPKVLFP